MLFFLKDTESLTTFLKLFHSSPFTIFFFPLFKFIFFNWRMIALKYCVVFCHSSTWINRPHTYGPSLLSLPPTPFHPSSWSQSTGFELPVSYSKSSLSVLHMVMYMFPCYSLNPSLLLPCHVQESVLYVFISIRGLVAQSCLTLVAPWIVVHQAPLSMEFPR